MSRVGQSRIYTPYMTVCMVVSLPKLPYIHRITYNVWSWPTLHMAHVLSHAHMITVGHALKVTVERAADFSAWSPPTGG
jgi:hypothetical protein